MTYAIHVADLDDLDTRTTITDVTELETVERGNDTPTGSKITLQNDHPQLSELVDGRVVLLEESGEITASFVLETEHDDHLVAPSQGGGGKQVTVKTGRPLLSVFDRATVRSTLGYGRKPWSKSRPFGVGARGFDPSSWGFATVLVAKQSDESTYWTGLPRAWPNPDASWIGPAGGSDADGYAGHWYVIGDFTLDADAALIFFTAADNEATIYFDGFLLSSFGTDNGFGDTKRPTIYATAGVHRIVAKVTNVVDGGTEPGLGMGSLLAGNPTGFICSVYTIEPSGRIGGLVIQSDDLWRILEYPDPAPGMTITQIARIVIEEQQAEGLIPYVTLNFTDTEFSDGSDAPVLESVTVGTHDGLLTCLKAWALAGYCDVVMPPDATELSLYPFGGAGTASGVTYSIANGNLALEAFDTVDAGIDCLDVMWEGGPPFRYPAEGGTRKGSISTRSAVLAEAESIAAAVIDRQSERIEQVTIALTPTGDADTPGLGVKLFDSATFPARPSGTVEERVMEIRKKLTSRGIESAVALRDVHLSDLDRIDLVLQQMLSGTLGGTAPASPADPPPPFGSNIDTTEITFSLSDPPGVTESHDKIPKQSGNLFAVAITAKIGGSTDTTIEFKVDGVDVLGGAGVLPAFDEKALIPVVPFVWVEGYKTRTAVAVTAVGTGLSLLVVEPLFL